MSTISGTVTSPSNGSDLSHINEEIYKKNAELAGKNKVLQLLRKIDEIVLSTITDPKQIGEQVTELIVQEIGFRCVGIFKLQNGILEN
ncbi:MAG: hypothetical protein WBB58_00190, partial [Microgenomates group bacterium]